MTLDALYREELAFLREMGREVALKQPGLCDSLAQTGTDPDVERLLEGFAFLAARTRARADDAIPEAIESIAEVIAPHALRPVPASTVMELTPRAALVRERVHVARGAAFGSRPVDGVRCELRSTAAVDLLPLTLDRAVLDRADSRSARLVMSFRVARSALEALHADRPLRLFIHAPLAAASTLALAIDRHLDRVTYRSAAGASALGRLATLVDPDREPHLPWPERSPETARHLLELAYFPERHLFFDVGGLARVPITSRAEHFEIELAFGPEAPLPDRLATDALRLHCVPAINVFSTSAEPITWQEGSRDVLLRATELPAHAAEVYEVDCVIGLPEGTRTRARYRSSADFAQLDGARAEFFALRRARSPLDGAVDTFLRVGGRSTRGTETLSIEMRCTNRTLVGALRTGDVCEPLVGSPAAASFVNLAPMGPRASAPVGEGALYALVGVSGTARRAPLDAESLRAWLAPFTVSPAVDIARARAVASLTGAIRSLGTRPFHAARRGLVERGVGIELELDESRAPSIGEAFLFARAIDRALATELPLNVQQRLELLLSPSRRRIVFDLRDGASGR